MDIIYYAVLGVLIGYVFGKIVKSINAYLDNKQVAQLQQVLDSSVFVTVEKHESKGMTTFLMFTLVDDKFLMQAPTAAELAAKVREKFPNKQIMIHGNDEIAGMPEFGGRAKA